MAALAHAGVGLAAKRIAPGVPIWILLAAAWIIDMVWGVLFVAGIEHAPGPEASGTNPFSHGLLMAVIWSVLSALIAFRVSRYPRLALIIGLLVFSHWVVDFASHPMTAMFPGDTPLSLLFDGSPTVGLGLYGTQIGTDVCEYGALLLGTVVYVFTLIKLRREQAPPAQPEHGGSR